MSEPKPLASLSSSLLARKGGARPAMRRQGMAFPVYSDHEQEDLGWNDMGYDTNPDHEAPRSDDYGSEDSGQYHYNPLAGAIPDAIPAVRKQQEEIAAKLSLQSQRETEIAAEPVERLPREQTPKQQASKPQPIGSKIAPVVEDSPLQRKKVVQINGKAKPPAVTRTPAQKSRTGKAKIAFTLRLDPDRHLKLRLATAVKNVSAQQLVTKAVDEYLKTIPEIDDLAGRIPSRGTV